MPANAAAALFNWLLRAAAIGSVAEFDEFVGTVKEDSCINLQDVGPSQRIPDFRDSRELYAASSNVSHTKWGTTYVTFDCEDEVLCFRGQCQVPLKSIEYKSEASGPLAKGTNYLVSCDGSRTFARYGDFGIFHGPVIKTSEIGTFKSAEIYNRGNPVGRSISFEAYFSTLWYNDQTETGQDVMIAFWGRESNATVLISTPGDKVAHQTDLVSIETDGTFPPRLELSRERSVWPAWPWFNSTLTQNGYEAHQPDAEILFKSAALRNALNDAAKSRKLRFGNESSEGVSLAFAFHRIGHDKRLSGLLQVAEAPKGYYNSPYWLACMEGSGSKYLQFAFARMTGENSGDTVSPLDGSIALVKTHHTFPELRRTAMDKYDFSNYWTASKARLVKRLLSVATFSGRTVLLVRNPFETIVSVFTHYSLEAYASVKTFSFFDTALNCTQFRIMAAAGIDHWEKLYTDYIMTAPHLLVVHFEDARTDVLAEVDRIREHMGLPEFEEERIALFNEFLAEDTGYFARPKRRTRTDPFQLRLRARIDEAMARVNGLLLERGHRPLPTHKYRFFNETF